MSNNSNESASTSCPYCAAEQPDYDITAQCCRARFRLDWMRYTARPAYTMHCTFAKGSDILQVREEPEE